MNFRARLGPLVLSALVLIALGVWRLVSGPPGAGDGAFRAREAPLAALAGATGWLNGGPPGADSLRGRVTLVAVWSATDPLAVSALPELEAWSRAYAHYGTRVVGVHVPDYSFAADSTVPAGVLRRSGATFPVALDGSYRVLAGLGEEEGPLPWLLVVGPRGRTVGSERGDASDLTHRAIREALRGTRAGAGLAPNPEVDPAPPRAPRLRRVFLGTSRVEHGPLATVRPGTTVPFAAPLRAEIEGESWTPYLAGWWSPNAEGVTATRGGAAEILSVRSEGGDAWLVAGPPPDGHGKVWVLADEEWIAPQERGADLRADHRGATYVEVTGPGLLHLSRAGAGHVYKLSPDEPGITFYELSFVTR